MITLSNIDIMEICNKFNIKIQGIYNRNTIPSILKRGWYILNLDLSENDGTHWTCFYKNNDDSINIYFDSFGFVPPEHLDKLLKTYIYNNKEIQNVRSSSCGWFCLACIFNCENLPGNIEHNFERFIHMFGENTELNESILQQFWSEL